VTNIASSPRASETPKDPLGIESYLEASSDASRRTRNITFTLIVASVLVFAGLLNSFQGRWMQARMHQLGNIHGEYTQMQLGPYPHPNDDKGKKKDEKEYEKEVTLYEQRYRDLWSAVARAHVENSLVIRVPVFGFTLDVNDLGVLGGIGFVFILGCLRFFLSREVDNLRLSFQEALGLGAKEFGEFYNLLAMKQVFTVPLSKYIKVGKFLKIPPKLLPWLPTVMQVAVVGYDLKTRKIGELLNKERYRFEVGLEALIALILIYLAVSVTLRLIRVDEIWSACWKYISNPLQDQRSSDDLKEALSGGKDDKSKEGKKEVIGGPPATPSEHPA
jgi:hypothetical protein